MVKGYTKIFHKYNNKLKRKDRSEGQEAYPATSTRHKPVRRPTGLDARSHCNRTRSRKSSGRAS
jgi:hypothetical protein